jgi:hypothetical protein
VDGKFSKISANSFCTQRGTASALAVIAEGASSGDRGLISALSIARKHCGASRVPIIGELLMLVACCAAVPRHCVLRNRMNVARTMKEL